METLTHTLSDAAQLSGASPEELLRAVKDGLIRARFLQNTGEYHLNADDLARYMKRTRRQDAPLAPARRRVLLIDGDVRFADQVKLELERDRRIEVKYANWSKDAVRMAREVRPDLFLMAATPSTPLVDEVVQAVREQRAASRARLVVYSARTYAAPAGQPDLETRVREMEPDEFLSLAMGMRILIIKCAQLLDLDTKTQILRRTEGL